MSSIRLFILGSLETEGEMHGHQLRQLAEKQHVDLWTDITVGGLYGAIKRLAGEGLITEVRTERDGAYPERQIWAITDAGRDALTELRRSGLSSIVFRADPFDLALTRLDPDRLDELPAVVEARIAELRDLLAAQRRLHERASGYLRASRLFLMTHRITRLTAEIEWHEELLGQLPEIIADEVVAGDTASDHRSRKDS